MKFKIKYKIKHELDILKVLAAFKFGDRSNHLGYLFKCRYPEVLLLPVHVGPGNLHNLQASQKILRPYFEKQCFKFYYV